MGFKTKTTMNHVYIIAEAGVNHNGEPEKALQLVDIAAESGADAVKFQTFSADRLVIKGAPTAQYQKEKTGETDQYNLLKKLELPLYFYPKLIEYCQKKGIEFLSTPFDEEAAEILIKLGMKKIKVPSGELTNLPFLKFLASKKLPMIVSTGMSNLEEVQQAVEIITQEMDTIGFRDSNRLSLLHCTSNYPTPLNSVNLRSMEILKKQFKVPCGYSDHTEGIQVSILAAAAGAKIIEKHFTLDRNLSGPDHKASIEPQELKEMVKQIRLTEQILGEYKKEPTTSELSVRTVVRKSIATARAIKAGEKITEKDLIFIRPGTGISPAKLKKIVGKYASKDLSQNYILNEKDIT